LRVENTAAIGAVPKRRKRRRDRKRRDRRRVSEVLRALIGAHQEPRITVRQLRDALGDRAYGVLFFIFAFPNLAPMPPGVSTIFAIPLLLLSAQFFLGASFPYFPRWLGERSFARADFEKALNRIRPTLRRIERLLQPRLLWLTSHTGERILGALFFILAFVMCLPIPLGHWFPAVAICIMALALVERDGLVLLGGVTVGVVSLVIVSAVVIAMVKALFYFLTHSLGS
jgi:hypothetical protein